MCHECNTRWAFGEHLKGMLFSHTHCLEDLEDKVVWNILVEEVRHRIYKDGRGLLPLQRYVQSVWPELQIKTLLVWMARYSSEALGKGTGVTVVTPGANLSTSCNRIPRLTLCQ